jgi:hypothetical protein
MGDKVVSDHTFRLLGDNFRAIDNMDTAFHTTGQVTFTTTTGLHLSFDNETF